jgi:hypothetical protein
MKHLTLAGMCLSLLLSATILSAQDVVPVNEPNQKRPLLFKTLPEKVTIQASDLKSLIAGGEGKTIRLQMGTGALEGKVVSAVNKYNNNIRSVVIRSSNFNGATLTLSSSTKRDGTVKITGRLISIQHGDLYELEKENEQYVLVKKNYYDLINE